MTFGKPMSFWPRVLLGTGGLQAAGLNHNFYCFRNYSLMLAEEKLLAKMKGVDKLAGVQWVGSWSHLPVATAS